MNQSDAIRQDLKKYADAEKAVFLPKEYEFIKRHYQKMPRPMLRYAIEKFNPGLRKNILPGQF